MLFLYVQEFKVLSMHAYGECTCMDCSNDHPDWTDQYTVESGLPSPEESKPTMNLMCMDSPEDD